MGRTVNSGTNGFVQGKLVLYRNLMFILLLSAINNITPC